MNYVVCFLIVVTSVVPLLPESVWARQDIVKRDTNKDGKIDQIAHFDKRAKIIKLEIDSNAQTVSWTDSSTTKVRRSSGSKATRTWTGK